MATTRRATHTRANMYGLARHANHQNGGRLLATPLYRRVVPTWRPALPAGALVLDSARFLAGYR